MSDLIKLTDEQLLAVQADAEMLMTLLIDEEAEGEVEAGQLLLESVPSVCAELAAAREENARLRDALEFYADFGLWKRAFECGEEDSSAREDMGTMAREALRAG